MVTGGNITLIFSPIRIARQRVHRLAVEVEIEDPSAGCGEYFAEVGNRSSFCQIDRQL